MSAVGPEDRAVPRQGRVKVGHCDPDMVDTQDKIAKKVGLIVLDTAAAGGVERAVA